MCDGGAQYFGSYQFHHYKHRCATCSPIYEYNPPISAVYLIPTPVPVTSELSHVSNIFPLQATMDKPLRLSYEWDVLTHSDEELNHRCHLNASVVTSPLLSLLQYLERYLTCFDSGCLHRMPNNGNELKVQDRSDQRRDTAVARWSRRWDH